MMVYCDDVPAHKGGKGEGRGCVHICVLTMSVLFELVFLFISCVLCLLFCVLFVGFTQPNTIQEYVNSFVINVADIFY